jgi:hypothetical protein
VRHQGMRRQFTSQIVVSLATIYDAEYTDDTALPPAPPVSIHHCINTKTPIVKLAWTCGPINMQRWSVLLYATHIHQWCCRSIKPYPSTPLMGNAHDVLIQWPCEMLRSTQQHIQPTEKMHPQRPHYHQPWRTTAELMRVATSCIPSTAAPNYSKTVSMFCK